MKIKQLAKILESLDQEKDIVLSSDEELNIMYNRFEVSELEDTGGYVIWGYSGSELNL